MKKILKILVFIIIIIAISIGINKYNNKLNSISSNSVSSEPMKGLGLFISNENNDQHNQVINYLHIDEYKYNFINETNKKINCNLNVFINGKQIKLINKETGEICNNFQFTLNNNERKEIPIKLCLENFMQGAYIANFNIVTDFNKYAIDEKEKVWLNSTYNYTVAIENNSKTISIPENNNIKLQQESIENNTQSSQFIINYTKDEFNEKSIPKNYIETNPGSTIEVPLILGGNDESERLIYATLDNNQILINNSKTLVYNLVKNKLSTDRIKIQIPQKKGKYELLFYSLSNFKNANINDIGSLKFSTSHRVTILSK